jgi:ribA/ribD-fused uncharacterized protein
VQAAKFNKDQGKDIRRWIREAAEPKEAKNLGCGYNRKPFKRVDFYEGENNLEIMFDIALAKFQQNSKLKHWLLQTDREKRGNQIFHFVEDDSFWALGPLQSDGKYHGKNWNGKILMMVRSVISAAEPSDDSRCDSVPPDVRRPIPFPYLDPDDSLNLKVIKANVPLLQKVLERFLSARSGPLPKGSMIAQRYRIVHEVKTGQIK